MLTELTGQIERVTFTNQDKGYTVAKLKVSGRRELVTAVGCLMSPVPGEVLRMTAGSICGAKIDAGPSNGSSCD